MVETDTGGSTPPKKEKRQIKINKWFVLVVAMMVLTVGLSYYSESIKLSAWIALIILYSGLVLGLGINLIND